MCFAKIDSSSPPNPGPEMTMDPGSSGMGWRDALGVALLLQLAWLLLTDARRRATLPPITALGLLAYSLTAAAAAAGAPAARRRAAAAAPRASPVVILGRGACLKQRPGATVAHWWAREPPAAAGIVAPGRYYQRRACAVAASPPPHPSHPTRPPGLLPRASAASLAASAGLPPLLSALFLYRTLAGLGAHLWLLLLTGEELERALGSSAFARAAAGTTAIAAGLAVFTLPPAQVREDVSRRTK